MIFLIYSLRLLRKCIFVIVSFVICHFSYSQQPAHFFLGEEVFSGVQIYDVIQDNENNYWFATDQGFYKYNGYVFEKIKTDELKGEAAFGFVKSKQGIIYCHNLNGQIIRIQNGRCELFYELENDEQARDTHLETSDDGLLFVFSAKMFAIKPDGKKVVFPIEQGFFGAPFRQKDGSIIAHRISTNEVYRLNDSGFEKFIFEISSIDNTNLFIFFEIDKKIYAINREKKDIVEVDLKNKKFVWAGSIQNINKKEFYRFYKAKNKLWMAGSNSGVLQLDKEGNATSPFFTDYLISDVFEDHEGNLLFSTFNHGIIVVPDLNILDVLNISRKKSMISLALVNDKLAMGSLDGEFGIYDKGNYEIVSSKGNKPIQHAVSWPGFPYVFYDDGKLHFYNDETGKNIIIDSDMPLKDAVLIGKDSMYYGTSGKLILVTGISMNNPTPVPVENFKKRVYAIDYLSKEKTLYIASADGLITFRKDSFKLIRNNGKVVFSNDVCVYENEMYVADNEGNMYVYKNDKLIRSFEIKINHTKTVIKNMRIQNEMIFASTTSGFVIFDLSGKVIHQLNRLYGFYTNTIFDFEIKDNEIWIAHSKGIQKFDIHELNTKIDQPFIKLLSIWVNDSISTTDTQENYFDHTHRKFSFDFSSASIRNKENIVYHYKLEGYDKEWNQLAYDDHFITYNGLDPGTYTFRVKAENRGVYSDTINYSFTIMAPFYKRWWFFILLGLVLISITFIVYRYQLQRQRRKSEIINEINLSRLAAIQSQMNPHFIFNSLNSIQDLVLKGDIDNSYIFITKFSDLIRRTLNYSDKDFISFEQEMKLLELYLVLEKLRYKSDLIYTIETGKVKEKETILLPPMLIQPFIENALVHGLLHKSGSKELKITFYLDRELVCIIEDNGVGRLKAREIKERQRSGHESFSSQAIKKRFAILKEQYGGELGFEYEDLYDGQTPSGTRVVLRIPIRYSF